MATLSLLRRAKCSPNSSVTSLASFHQISVHGFPNLPPRWFSSPGWTQFLYAGFNPGLPAHGLQLQRPFKSGSRSALASLVTCPPTRPGGISIWSCTFCSVVHGGGKKREKQGSHCLENHKQPPAMVPSPFTHPAHSFPVRLLFCSQWDFSQM